MHTSTLLLVGCGNMGSALLARWQASKPAGIERFYVIEPHGGAPGGDAIIVPDMESLPDSLAPDVIVLAVKPQQLSAILPAYAKRFGAAPLYLSIAAGKRLAFYAAQLGGDARVVRAMPNTPAMIGQGVTLLCAAPGLPASDKKLAAALMQAAGFAAWVEDEEQLHAVTALSGCGPAYVFLFLESLTNAAVSLGLPETLAKTLALHTLSGSAALAEQSGEAFATLRRNVASPGGSTEAALAILMQDGAFEKLIKSALTRAAERSRELAE